MVAKLKAFSTTPANNNATPPNGWPEGMAPSDVNNTARENLARMQEWYQDAEWLNLNHASLVTGFTGTTLTITGDVTDRFILGRALRFDEVVASVGIITAAVFSAGSTTVTVAGYTILGTPTALELGIVSHPRSLPNGGISNSSVVWGGTSGGSANAQTLTIASAVSAYTAGQTYAFLAGFTNTTTTPTININGVGANTIKSETGGALIAGAITAGTIYELRYDGTNFRLISTKMSAAAVTEVQSGQFLWGGTSGGSANAQTITLTPAITAYAAGQAFAFIAGFTNTTTTPTLNVNGVGANTIKSDTGGALVASQITAGCLYVVRYDGTNFRLMLELSAPYAKTFAALATFSAGADMTPAAAPSTTAAGYLGVPQNAQNAAYTFVMADAGKHIFHDEVTARTYTIPANGSVAFPIGTTITIINNVSAGNITLAITTDTLRRGDGTAGTGSRTISANSIATIVKTKATEWLISGVFT